MAVEPKLSDQEIASLLEIPHPSKGLGESIHGATKVFPDNGAEIFPGMRDENNQLRKFMDEGGRVLAHMQDAMIEYARKGALINTTWMFWDVRSTLDLGQRAELAVRGLRAAPPLRRRAGAGPSDDGHWTLEGAPLALPMAPDSPCQRGPDGTLTPDGVIVDVDLEPVARPRLYDLQTADGIPYEKLARLHGRNVLATTVVQTCVRYSEEATRCRFCTIEDSLKAGATTRVKRPELWENPDELVAGAKRLIGWASTRSSCPTRPPQGSLTHEDGVSAPSHEIVADIRDRVGSTLRKAGMRGADQSRLRGLRRVLGPGDGWADERRHRPHPAARRTWPATGRPAAVSDRPRGRRSDTSADLPNASQAHLR